MTTYRERLTAPISWWIAALVFAAVWGWVVLLVTTWPIAIAVTVVIAAGDLLLVRAYGSVLVTVGPDGLTVGRASLDPQHVGDVVPLHRVEYRERLGTGADARAYLVTRPYLDRGVLVPVDDPADPVPYWLVSSRHPDALAAALGHDVGAHETTTGEAPRGEEA